MRREPFDGDFFTADVDQGALDLAVIFKSDAVAEGIFAPFAERRRWFAFKLENLGVQAEGILKSIGPGLAMGRFAT